MTIHICNTNDSHIIGNKVFVNCKKKLEFRPMCADINGRKICEKCKEEYFLRSKSKNPPKYTFYIDDID